LNPRTPSQAPRGDTLNLSGRRGFASLPRRIFLAGALATAPRHLLAGQVDAAQAGWLSFRDKFVAPNGRVIDNGNGGISHSEGQGWGMLFAVTFNDRDTFERILGWTSKNLSRPHDALHAWRYVPNKAPATDDLNNATDGDIFIAAALARAAKRWDVLQHKMASIRIADDILKLLVRRLGQYRVLLPGVQGFERSGEVILNPSYYAVPLITELSQTTASPLWNDLLVDGAKLVRSGRFGKWMLPPDWLRLGRTSDVLDPASGWPRRFSFDAIRVPLWFTWGRMRIDELQSALERFWTSFPPGEVPAWVDLVSNETAPYPATPGMVAVSRLTLAAIHDTAFDPPAITPEAGYYDSALMLLSQIAWRELTVR
jgi:endoglucanase